MAIKHTISWLQSKIPESKQRDAIRKRFGRVRDHKIVYPSNWIQDELANAFKKAAYQNWHKDNPGRQPTKPQVQSLNTLARKHTYTAYQYAYNRENIIQKCMQVKIRPNTIEVEDRGRDCIIRFATNTGADFEGFVSWGNRKRFNVASEQLLKEAGQRLVRLIKKDPSIKKSIANGITAGNTKTGKAGVLNQLRTPFRLHGFPSGDLNPDYPGQDDTTIALLGFEENLHATSPGQLESDVEMFLNSTGSQQPLYEQIMKDIHDNWFDVQWKVNNKKFSDIKEFRDKIQIAIVIGHSSKNSLMRYADADGISDYLEEIRKVMVESLNKNATDWAETQSSRKTPRQRMEEQVVEATIKPIVKQLKKNPKVKVTTKRSGKFKKTSETTKGKKTVSRASAPRGGKRTKLQKSSKAKIATVAAASAASKRRSGSGKGSGTQDGAMNPIGLQQLLNKSLPAEVVNNMGPYPRKLENRTGRFAQSAQVTQVVPMPKSVEIRYSYQKDPYAVFEPEFGNPLATPGRDPKRIIGGTIREIAQEIMGTRYGLVRTKRV